MEWHVADDGQLSRPLLAQILEGVHADVDDAVMLRDEAHHARDEPRRLRWLAMRSRSVAKRLRQQAQEIGWMHRRTVSSKLAPADSGC